MLQDINTGLENKKQEPVNSAVAVLSTVLWLLMCVLNIISFSLVRVYIYRE